MGNTLIQDSKTGHIMGLSEGFVPVGLKEHGGIMYIASVNKDGVGEIGTIPSPILTLSPNDSSFVENNKTLVYANGPETKLTLLNDQIIAPGEKFLIGLNLDLNTPTTWYSKPVVTCFSGNDLVRGVYNIKLYTIYDTNSVCLDKLISTPQSYWRTGAQSPDKSEYWFITSDLITDIDINKTYIAKEFKTYPGNIPAGRLAVKVELENIDSFSLMKSIQTEGVNAGEATLAPKVIKDKKTKEYTLEFPGFEYKTSSARFVGKVEFCLYDQKTKEVLYNSKNVSGWEQGVVRTETDTEVIKNVASSNLNIYRICNPSALKPLFSYNIGSSFEALNSWYQIVVTYYDQFGGKINTYKYSFNPYHVLNFEENYQLSWIPGLEYEQRYDWDEEDFQLDVRGDLSVVPQSADVQYTTAIKQWSRSSEVCSPSNSGTGKSVYNFALLIEQSDDLFEVEGTKDPLTIEGSLNQSNLKYLYNPRTTNVYINPFQEAKWYFTHTGSSQIGPCVVRTDKLPDFSLKLNTYKFNNWSKTDDEFGNLLDAAGNDIQSNYTTGGIIQNPTIYIGQYNTESSFEYKVKDAYSFEITNYGFEIVSLFEKIETGNESLSGSIGITVELTSNDSPKIITDPLLYNSISDYTIIPSAALFGDSDTKFDMAMGLDRDGRPQPAWTFGKSLLTSVGLEKQNANSSFVKTVEYLPKTKIITQIIYPGTYLLNLNAYSKSGHVDIQIGGLSVRKDIVDYYFTPQLIYVSKETRLTLSWSNIEKLRNIGLYQLSKPVWYSDRTQFGENKEYNIIDYQDASLDIASEVIIPLQASYYEEASCYDRPYDYYHGPDEAFMTDRHKLLNGDFLNFVYKWDVNDKNQAQVDEIPDFDVKPLTYRNEKQ